MIVLLNVQQFTGIDIFKLLSVLKEYRLRRHRHPLNSSYSRLFLPLEKKKGKKKSKTQNPKPWNKLSEKQNL